MGYCRVSFFFSSRRRHTRLVSDWSSGVCSSDLTRVMVSAYQACVDYASFVYARRQEGLTPNEIDSIAMALSEKLGRDKPRETLRSEERRVGKERRCRRGTSDKKKKNKKPEGSGE